MSDTIQSNVEFALTGTLTESGTSVTISDDSTNGGVCSFTDASILLTNARGTIIERVKGTASAGTLTLSKRGITQDQTLTEDAGLKKEWRPGTRGFVTVFAYDHFDIEGDLNVNGNVTPVDVTKPGFRPQSLTQAQINALLTSGQGLVWNSTTGLYNVLQAGAWVPLDTGTVTPNASATVAGKVETATDAQVTASTDTGETGALLYVLPSQANKIVSLAGTETAIAEDDLLVFSDTDASGVNKKITKANARETMAASTTAKGTVEMATNAEALAGTDEQRYVNAKQMKDVFGVTVMPSDNILANSSAEENTISATYVLLKEIAITRAGTYRTYFGLRSNNSNSVFARVYKNGVALGTERTTTSSVSAVYFTEDFIFEAGDLVQLYARISSATNSFVSNFQIRGSAFPTSGIPVVNS